MATNIFSIRMSVLVVALHGFVSNQRNKPDILCRTCPDDAKSLTACIGTMTCALNEVCYTTEIVDFDTSHAYRAGCIPKQLCVTSPSAPRLLGRSFSTMRITCCDWDFCNIHVPITTSPIPGTTKNLMTIATKQNPTTLKVTTTTTTTTPYPTTTKPTSTTMAPKPTTHAVVYNYFTAAPYCEDVNPWNACYFQHFACNHWPLQCRKTCRIC